MDEKRNLTLSIKADTNDAERKLKSLGTVSSDVRKKFSSLATEVGRFSGGVAIVTATVGAAGLALRELGQAAEAGQRIENVNRAFENLATRAGVDATSQLEKLTEATRGTVSQFELMQKSAQAAQLGLDIDSLDELAESARKLGQAVGRDSAQAFDDLVTGVGRGSRLILDNVGVIVKADEAYQDLAEELGKTTDQLTFQEKALEEIQRTAEGLPESVGGAGEAFQQASASVENLVDRFQVALNQSPALQQSFSEIADTLEDFDVQPLVTGMEAVFEVIADIVDVTNRALLGIQALVKGEATLASDKAFNRLVTENASVSDAGRSASSQREELFAAEREIDRLRALRLEVGESSSQGVFATQRIEALSDRQDTLRLILKETRRYIDIVEKADRPELTSRGLSSALGGSTPLSDSDQRAQAKVFAEALFDNRPFLPGTNPGFDISGIQLSNLDSLVLGIQEIDEQINSVFGAGTGNALANTIGIGLADALENGFDGFGQTLGAGVGGVLGSALGPAGSAFGALGGQVLGQGLEELLAGEGGIRSDVALSVLAGVSTFGLSSLGSSVFGSNVNASEQGRRGTTDALTELLGSSEFLGVNVGRFDGVQNGGAIPFATGLGNLLGNGTDGTAQIANLLENFTTGSTEAQKFNDLVVVTSTLLDELNITAEQGKDQLKEAFLDGQVSLEDFGASIDSFNLAATNNLQGEGSVTEAVRILGNTITESPRQALKALELALIEAGEVGEGTVDGLISNFAGELGPDLVAVFSEIKDSGINSLEDLNNISADQLRQVFDALAPIQQSIVETFGGFNQAADETVSNADRMENGINRVGESLARVQRQARDATNALERFGTAGANISVEPLGIDA